MQMKKHLLISSAVLLMLSSASLLSAAPAQATETNPVVTYTHEHVYFGVRVHNGWDYSVWSEHQNGERLGSMNDVHSYTLLEVTHEAYVGGVLMLRFNSPELSGWVAADALFTGAYYSGAIVRPVSYAYNYGIWTHFRGGSHVDNLSKYQDRDLTIKHIVHGWALIHDGEREIGYVSLAGLTQAGLLDVDYTATPISNGWDYSVWSHYQDGARRGSLNDARNELLQVSQEMVVDGMTMAYFESNSLSGWVVKHALHTNIAGIWDEGVPVHNAWDYGVWSHFKGGQRLDSLNSYRGRHLTAVLRGHDGFLLVKDGYTTIGWVHRDGIRFGYAFEPYAGVPVANAWDYSVWSNHTNGTRLGSMNDYANTWVTVEAENPDGSMVQFAVDGRVIGWVSPNAILKSE